MLNNLDNIMDDIKNFLSKNEEFEDMNIEYVLMNKENIENSVVLASNGENAVEIECKTKQVIRYQEWNYNLDTEIFEYLEKGYEIGFMSDEWHYNIWTILEETDIKEDIDYKTGMQKYLKYCKDNEITKDYLEKDFFDVKVFDIMQYYEDNSKKNKEKIKER